MDLNDLIKEINLKHETEKKEELGDLLKNGFFNPPQNQNDDFWITAILLLILLELPKKEEKEPIINIIIGGDK